MEKLKESVRIVKEKSAEAYVVCKKSCMYVYTKGMPFIKQQYTNIYADKRKRLIAILVIAIVLIGAGTSVYVSSLTPKSAVFASIKKGNLVGSGQVGSKVQMGDLEVTLIDTIEGTYDPLELDAQGKRIIKPYFGARVMIYNTGSQTEKLIFGLTDASGNQYERDKDVEFYTDIKDFGPAPEIYPRTIRGDERYLLFLDPPAGKKLQLTVMSETTNKKIVFDIAH